MKIFKILTPLLISIFFTSCASNEEPSSSSSNEPINIQSITPKDIKLEGHDIETEGGKYDYSLIVKPDLTLTMDIDLSLIYEEIDGDYNLHYEIDYNKQHTLIVSGTFKNVIVNSPLLDKKHPEVTSRFLNIVESLGFFTPDEEGKYDWIEEICLDPENWVQTNISENSYSYKLDLKTAEDFSFVNALCLLIYDEQYNYSLSFNYSLPIDN